MSDTIYLACVRLEKLSGGYDYDPAIDPTNPMDIKMIACDDLVALQNDNIEALDALRDIADVVIVPVTLETYNALKESLAELASEVDEKIDDAAKNMAAAYKIMGIEADIEKLKATMMVAAGSCGGVGKVLNESMEIVDRADDYITYDEEEEYDDENDYESDDDYEESEDDDYEEDDE